MISARYIEMRNSDKRLKKDYQQTPPPMGVFLIRNTANDKVFVGAGLNLRGTMNRHRFQLNMGGHANQRLQADWSELGSSNFTFEIVDQLQPRPDGNDRADLESLLGLWLERLRPFGAAGYNERKLTRAELLRQIAAKH